MSQIKIYQYYPIKNRTYLGFFCSLLNILVKLLLMHKIIYFKNWDLLLCCHYISKFDFEIDEIQKRNQFQPCDISNVHVLFDVLEQLFPVVGDDWHFISQILTDNGIARRNQESNGILKVD